MKRPLSFLLGLWLLTSCSSDDYNSQINTTDLQAVAHDVLLFEYTADTGEDSSRLEFRIRFSNPNNLDVTGIPHVTISVDDNEETLVLDNPNSCTTIVANSDCLLIFEAESPHFNGIPGNITLVSVEYVFN